MRHVTVNVKDLDTSIAFYTKYIGLHIAVDLREMGPQIVFMAQKDDNAKLELVAGHEPLFSGSGISVGFEIDDLEGTRKWFLEEGLEVSPVISPNPRTSFFFVTDPNGLQVQLIREE